MKTIYFDCNMGVSADMFLAALLDLHPNPQGFVRRLNSLGLPGASIRCNALDKSGVKGIQVRGLGKKAAATPAPASGQRRAYGLSALRRAELLLESLPVTQIVQDRAKEICRLLAEAKSQATGTAVTALPPHALDAMEDLPCLVGACLLMEELAPRQVLASRVHMGGGVGSTPSSVSLITSYILRDAPTYRSGVPAELCTPVGAALLWYFADCFTDLPTMHVTGIGYGMGTMDLEVLHCLRAFAGNTADIPKASALHPQQVQAI